MAIRVRDFSRAHPYANERYAAVVARLEDRTARAQALDTQQQGGRLLVRAMTVSREQYLKHLAAIAVAVSAEEPELAARFPLPPQNASQQDFVTAARAMAAEAEVRRDLFTSYGLPDSFLADLATALSAYDATVDEAHAGRGSHVGARAELDGVMAEIMQLARQLDAMNRYRFRSDREQLAAWASARDIAWPSGSGSGGGTGGGGEVVEPAA
jgi:hypothetical protein